jgi:hypothetical protein
MNRILKTIIFTGLIIMACNLPYISISPETGTATLAPTAYPTETVTPIITPTESIPTASATPELAPFCEPDLATVSPACHVPLAEEISTYCQDKSPYNTLLINPGSNFKVLTNNFNCTDGGMKGDRKMIVCTGPMAMTFEIIVCDASCIIPTVEAKAVQCPQDYHYNNLQGCCTKASPQDNESCKTLKFKTTSCVVNCGENKTDGSCRRNSNACEWDAKGGVCVRRK